MRLMAAVIWAAVAVGVMAMPTTPGGAASAPAFSFDDVRNMGDDRAQQYVEESIDKVQQASGGKVTELVKVITEAGAKCQQLPGYGNNYWCTYDSAAPGLAGLFIMREWKIVILYDESGKTTSVKVAVGRTGP